MQTSESHTIKQAWFAWEECHMKLYHFDDDYTEKISLKVKAVHYLVCHRVKGYIQVTYFLDSIQNSNKMKGS